MSVDHLNRFSFFFVLCFSLCLATVTLEQSVLHTLGVTPQYNFVILVLVFLRTKYITFELLFSSEFLSQSTATAPSRGGKSWWEYFRAPLGWLIGVGQVSKWPIKLTFRIHQEYNLSRHNFELRTDISTIQVVIVKVSQYCKKRKWEEKGDLKQSSPLRFIAHFTE